MQLRKKPSADLDKLKRCESTLVINYSDSFNRTTSVKSKDEMICDKAKERSSKRRTDKKSRGTGKRKRKGGRRQEEANVLRKRGRALGGQGGVDVVAYLDDSIRVSSVRLLLNCLQNPNRSLSAMSGTLLRVMVVLETVERGGAV